MFEIDPDVQEAVEEGIENEGSNLSGVSARCSWSEKIPPLNNPEMRGENQREGEAAIPQLSEDG